MGFGLGIRVGVRLLHPTAAQRGQLPRQVRLLGARARVRARGRVGGTARARARGSAVGIGIGLRLGLGCRVRGGARLLGAV